MNVRRYAIHPGWITSRTDGDRHFITAAQLIKLYKVNVNECVLWKPYLGMKEEDYIHLCPRYDGKYERPES